MGFPTPEFNPSQITTITPPGRQPLVKVFEVARTDTAEHTVAMLPAHASVLSVVKCSATTSNATTAAAVAVNLVRGGTTFSTGSSDVKTAPETAFVNMSNLPNAMAVPNGADIVVTSAYSQTGTSNTGGPWKFVVSYVA